MRRIGVVTGTRAEYGLLYWIIKGIHEDPQLELQLIVAAMHLSPEFGLTIKDIEKDGFPIARRVEMLLSSDSEFGIAASMGLGMIGFANAYERLNPDILVVLGDRFEILSAVASAAQFRIPVAHIHGGESTKGAIDDMYRHAITKMSHIHFPSRYFYAKRIIQMGERPERVFCVGAPGVDSVYKLSLLDRHALVKTLKIPLEKPYGVVTYHPVTLKKESAQSHMKELVGALKTFPDIYWIFTFPNAETESSTIIKEITKFTKNHPMNARVFTSLGQLKYLSLLNHAALMIGNSSSGIIEAPSFELPVVNIGIRQHGRIRAKNVIDVEVCKKERIISAIRRAISADFKNSLKGLKSFYGEGNTSEKIVEILKKIRLDRKLLQKEFFDLPQTQ